jgi:hypothetical protein
LGCCSHVAAVLWYLGYSRHQDPNLPKRRSLCDEILNAAAVRNFEGSETEDEEDGETDNEGCDDSEEVRALN